MISEHIANELKVFDNIVTDQAIFAIEFKNAILCTVGAIISPHVHKRWRI